MTGWDCWMYFVACGSLVLACVRCAVCVLRYEFAVGSLRYVQSVYGTPGRGNTTAVSRVRSGLAPGARRSGLRHSRALATCRERCLFTCLCSSVSVRRTAPPMLGPWRGPCRLRSGSGFRFAVLAARPANGERRGVYCDIRRGRGTATYCTACSASVACLSVRFTVVACVRRCVSVVNPFPTPGI